MCNWCSVLFWRNYSLKGKCFKVLSILIDRRILIVNVSPESSSAWGGLYSSHCYLKEELAKEFSFVENLTLSELKTYNPQDLEYVVGFKNLPNKLDRSLAILSYVKRLKPDIVIFPDMCGYAYYTIKAKQEGFISTEVVVIGHGSTQWNYVKNGFDLAEIEFEKKIEDYCIIKSDRFVPVSDSYNYWLLKQNIKNVNSKVIHNFSPNNSNLDEKLSEERIVFIGRNDNRKKLDFFLSFAQKMKLPATVYLSGEIDQKEFQSFNNLEIKMNKSSKEIFASINSENITVIIPSVAETSSMVALEVMNLKCKLLVANIEPFKELFSSETNIFFDHNISSLEEKYQKRESLVKELRYSQKEKRKYWVDLLLNLNQRNDINRIKQEVVPVEICILHSTNSSHLKKALNSVLNQTLKPSKITIINNAPEIELENIIDKTELKNINIFPIKERLIPSVARNTYLKVAAEEGIIFVDDDNVLDKSFLENIYSIWLKNKNQLITVNKTIIDKDGYIYAVKAYDNDLLKNQIFENRLGDTTFLCLTSVLVGVGGYPEIEMYEDWALLHRIADSGISIINNPLPDLGYRLHGKNLTSRKNHLKAYSEFLDAIDIDVDKQEELISHFVKGKKFVHDEFINNERMLRENIDEKYRVYEYKRTKIVLIDNQFCFRNLYPNHRIKLFIEIISFENSEIILGNIKKELKIGSNKLIFDIKGTSEQLVFKSPLRELFIKFIYLRINE